MVGLPTRMRPRVVPLLLVLLGAFLPTLGMALITVTVMIDQENTRPRANISSEVNPRIEVNNPPHQYFAAPDPRRGAFGATTFAECRAEGPAGPVPLERDSFGYLLNAATPGTHQVFCAPSEYGDTYVDVYADTADPLRYYGTLARIERFVLTGVVLGALSFPLLLVGLIMNGMAIARKRQVFGGGLPTAGTTTLVVSTVVAAPIAPVVLVLSQVFRVYTEPVSDWQVGGYVLGVGIGLVGFLIALWGLARIAADTKAQNAYARMAGLLAPTGPHVPPSGYPPAPPGGYPTRPPGY